jgi:hypothetical protein
MESGTRPPEPRVAGRCARCGREIYAGEAAYRLACGWLCPECLPEAARCWLAGYLAVAGERGEEA